MAGSGGGCAYHVRVLVEELMKRSKLRGRTKLFVHVDEVNFVASLPKHTHPKISRAIDLPELPISVLKLP